MQLTDFQTQLPLAPLTTFKIGGPADYFYEAHTPSELESAYTTAKKAGIDVFILGTGANILVGDKGFRGLVIHNLSNRIAIDQNLLTADSGATIADCITVAAASGLSGLEHFAGIPSSVGGALWQNLHFLDQDRQQTVFIGSVLESAAIIDKDLHRQTVSPDFFHFGYDYSRLHDERIIVLSAVFRLTPSDSAVINRRIQANLEWRQLKHPYLGDYPSAGSVFKQIQGVGAGRLIDQAGLKGFTLGKAQISNKHANFIVNTGGATAKDVLDLIRLVQDRVRQATGYILEPEISLIGEF